MKDAPCKGRRCKNLVDSRKSKSGLCRPCFLATPEQKAKALENGRAYVERNKEKVRAANRARMVEYNERNRERINARQREYNRAKKDEINAKDRARWASSPERRERAAEQNKRWRELNANQHRELQRRGAHNRRARERSLFVETVSPEKVYARDGGICHLCGCHIEFPDVHLDHIIPLVKNGTHEYANVAVSCAHCNLSKGAKCGTKDWALWRKALSAYVTFHGTAVGIRNEIGG